MSRAFIGMPAFPVGAKVALNDPQLRSNLDSELRDARAGPDLHHTRARARELPE